MIQCPSWCYRPVAINNIQTLQQELLAVAQHEIKDIQQLQPNFHYIPREQIEHLMPECMQFLDGLGLLSRWKYLAFVTGNHGHSLPLHVDTRDWTTRCYGLNIPVLNCAGSYTVFYRAAIDRPTQQDPTDPRASAWFCREDTAVEIDRIESVQPHWVNVCIPHRPLITHDLPRILSSFRFSPEVHDLI
jgi:hypothetical protein